MSQQMGAEAARALASLRKKELKVCASCGRPFEGFRHVKYCGQVCKLAAYRERHRDELNARRRRRYQAQKAEAGDDS